MDPAGRHSLIRPPEPREWRDRILPARKSL